MDLKLFDIERLKEVFPFEGSYTGFFPLNNGHINNTFVLEFVTSEQKHKSYVLQQINTNVFKDVDGLMENILGVTSHLRNAISKAGGNPDRETLSFLKASNGKAYFTDELGRSWRCYSFIPDTYTCNSIENAQVFYNAAKAFGKFQNFLADYPSETLHETIPNFHNTVSRFADFKKAVNDNLSGRKDTALKEIDFALAREDDAGVLLKLLDEGKLPLRVTHNDTKLNNVLFDNQSNEGICVIDLDTVMPGLSLYDFGDSIRFGANTATEDEKDLSKVSLDLNLFEQYVKGYLSTAGESLTEYEIEYLPFSAKLLTFECGIRFLGDYLNGDTYFKTAYPEHNLVRCRTQFALVADIEKKYDKMVDIVHNIIKK